MRQIMYQHHQLEAWHKGRYPLNDDNESNETIFYAGEATHEKYIGTVNGAYLSAQETAHIIIKLLWNEYLENLKFKQTKPNNQIWKRIILQHSQS